MLLIKPQDTRIHKRRLKSNLSFFRLSLVDQFMQLIEGSITGMKDYDLVNQLFSSSSRDYDLSCRRC